MHVIEIENYTEKILSFMWNEHEFIWNSSRLISKTVGYQQAYNINYLLFDGSKRDIIINAI